MAIEDFFYVQLNGFDITPTVQNSFLLMFMRMVLVVPLMASFATKLYPHTWQNIRELGNTESRPLL
ncbi:hypothetical protein [Okeania sp. SIO2C2]|uniref:hypothetical protein n=1 Tax=Okeania sp. SIO2C2 TaxID=2607787 RepID=UPI00257F9D37|nr:hypothetical protein [Okeania sp. SIO2C2]